MIYYGWLMISWLSFSPLPAVGCRWLVTTPYAMVITPLVVADAGCRESATSWLRILHAARPLPLLPLS